MKIIRFKKINNSRNLEVPKESKEKGEGDSGFGNNTDDSDQVFNTSQAMNIKLYVQPKCKI